MTVLIMIEYNPEENQLNIRIPVSGIHELYAYQKSILAVLSHIEIDDCNKPFMENLKSVYKLLGHLALDTEFLSEFGELIPQSKDFGGVGGREKNNE